MANVTNSTLLQTATGILNVKDACIVLIRTEWNDIVTSALEAGCRKILDQHPLRCIDTIVVPGAVEIPFGIKSYWDAVKYRDNRPTAFIALGCVIRGDTPHFEYVCKSVTEGVMHLNLQLPVPTIFGVLTVDNQQQADERIGGKHGHKGEEAALTALKMIHLLRSYKK
jgi:6,7-dimethyl-8-ribityllumazine synthase